MVTVLCPEPRTMCRNTVRHTRTQIFTHTHSYTYIKRGTEWLWWDPTPWGDVLGWMGALAGSLFSTVPGFTYSWHCCWVIMCLEGRRVHTSQQKRLVQPLNMKRAKPVQVMELGMPASRRPIPSHPTPSFPAHIIPTGCRSMALPCSLSWAAILNSLKIWLLSVIYTPPSSPPPHLLKIPIKCNIPWSQASVWIAQDSGDGSSAQECQRIIMVCEAH